MQIICQNKKARFLYEILKSYEAGIVLLGSEVKSIRQRHVSINEAFGKLIQSELFLINSNIAIYKESSLQNHQPTRMRKLLLKRSELNKLFPKLKEKNFTLVPLKLYFNDSQKIKVEIALARGKKLYDKRQTLKEKDLEIKAQKEMKNR